MLPLKSGENPNFLLDLSVTTLEEKKRDFLLLPGENESLESHVFSNSDGGVRLTAELFHLSSWPFLTVFPV